MRAAISVKEQLAEDAGRDWGASATVAAVAAYRSGGNREDMVYLSQIVRSAAAEITQLCLCDAGAPHLRRRAWLSIVELRACAAALAPDGGAHAAGDGAHAAGDGAHAAVSMAMSELCAAIPLAEPVWALVTPALLPPPPQFTGPGAVDDAEYYALRDSRKKG